MQYPFDFTHKLWSSFPTSAIIAAGVAVVTVAVITAVYERKHGSTNPMKRDIKIAIAASVLITLALTPFAETPRDMPNPTSDRALVHKVESHYDVTLRKQNSSDDHPYYEDAIFDPENGEINHHHQVQDVQFYDDHHRTHHGTLTVDIPPHN